MGSPICISKTARIHTVRTVRGAAMILNKVIRSAGESVATMDVVGYERLVEAVVREADEVSFSAVCPTWMNADRYVMLETSFEATQHGYTIITEFLQAVVDCRRARRAVALHFGVNYAWKGHEAFECVVIIDL